MEHPFYVSITDIKYNKVEGRIELSQKVFWDDLEIELTEIHKKPINILKPGSKKELNGMIGQYFLSSNEVIINGKEINLEYLGYEVEEDAVWVFLEGGNAEVPEKVKIRNTVLFGSFQSQQNIINFYMGSKPRSVITKRGRESGELRF